VPGRSRVPSADEAASTAARGDSGTMIDTRDVDATSDAMAETRGEANAAMDALRHVVWALRTSNASTEEKYRSSAAQLFMLSQVALQPKQSLSDVARRTLTSQSSASEVLARLVRRGFVDRHVSATDRRRIEFSTTRDGAHLLELAPGTVQQRFVSGFHALLPGHQRALAGAMNAWMVSAGMSEIPATMFMEEGRQE
jgi:DNA-binding MarR family transcriptional regulator